MFVFKSLIKELNAIGLEKQTGWHIYGDSFEKNMFRVLTTVLSKYDNRNKCMAKKITNLFNFANLLIGDVTISRNIDEDEMQTLNKNVAKMVNEIFSDSSEDKIKVIIEAWNEYTLDFTKESNYIKDKINFYKYMKKFDLIFVKDEGGHGFDIEFVLDMDIDKIRNSEQLKNQIYIFESEKEQYKNIIHYFIRIRFSFPFWSL